MNISFPLSALPSPTLKALQVSGASAGRFDINGAARRESFELAKVHCARALQVAPEDGIANMNVSTCLVVY